MDPPHGSEKRFDRDGSERWAPDAPVATVADGGDIDVAALLTRLETQAGERGKLEGRVQSLEQALRRERDARRRLAETLKRERRAAAAIHEQVEREHAARTVAEEELERVRENAAVTKAQVRQAWARLAEAECQLTHEEPGFWGRLFRRPQG